MYIYNMHHEHHLKSSDTIKDIVIGMSDGLTVPFALAAGLSGANAHSTIVVTAGIAEIVAGSIAMGLGGFLAGKTEADHYASELQREYDEVERVPEQEKMEVKEMKKPDGTVPKIGRRFSKHKVLSVFAGLATLPNIAFAGNPVGNHSAVYTIIYNICDWLSGEIAAAFAALVIIWSGYEMLKGQLDKEVFIHRCVGIGLAVGGAFITTNYILPNV